MKNKYEKPEVEKIILSVEERIADGDSSGEGTEGSFTVEPW